MPTHLFQFVKLSSFCIEFRGHLGWRHPFQYFSANLTNSIKGTRNARVATHYTQSLVRRWSKFPGLSTWCHLQNAKQQHLNAKICTVLSFNSELKVQMLYIVQVHILSDKYGFGKFFEIQMEIRTQKKYNRQRTETSAHAYIHTNEDEHKEQYIVAYSCTLYDKSNNK